MLYDGMESSIIHLKSPILGSVSEWQQVYCSDSGAYTLWLFGTVFLWLDASCHLCFDVPFLFFFCF